jgi:hypothetical protein
VLQGYKRKTQIDMADVGRPTVMTEAVLGKLEEAFSIGASDKEACFYAGINPDTLYEYCKVHPTYTERKQALKDMPLYAARKNIVKAINDGDKDMTKWYAERKAKNEFSTRNEIGGIDGKDLIPENTAEIDRLTAHLNAHYKGTDIPGDGEPPRTLGNQTSNKE